MTKHEMLGAFDQAIKTVAAQIEEAKKTELILEGKRQAFQESYDWIKTNIPEDVPAKVKTDTAPEAEEAEDEELIHPEVPTPVKEKKSK